MFKKIMQITIVFIFVCFHFPLYARDLGDVNGDSAIDILDENGTEAAAATADILSPPTMPEVVTITIDRPFYFVIRNISTGTILFFGKVLVL